MAHIENMKNIAQLLTAQWHIVLLPQRMEQQINYDNLRNTSQIQLLADSKEELMQAHFEKIKQSDAILICNEEKNEYLDISVQIPW